MVNIDRCDVELIAGDIVEGGVEGLETGSGDHDGSRDQGG
jgi:hypothetical protein